MPLPPRKAPTGKGRIPFLRAEITKTTRLREALIRTLADPDRANPAYLNQHIVSYSRHLLELRTSLDLTLAEEARATEEARLAKEAAAAAAHTPAPDATPEQRLRYDAEDAAACTLDDLEVYVEEWARRQHLRLDIVEGAPVLSRDASSLG